MERLEYKVYEPMKYEDERKKYLNQSIPQPCFRIVMLGQTGSGKSNLIKNFLFSKGFYRDYFSQLFCWVGSIDDVDEYNRLASSTKYRVWNENKDQYYKSKKEYLDEKLSVSHGADEDDLNELFQELEENLDDEATLWVFDDMICDDLLKSKRSIIDEVWIRGRHINLSAIISTQKYRFLSQNLRTLNTSQLILFFGLSKMELEAVAKENSGSLDEKQFIKLFKDNVKRKYQFLIINTREPLEKKFQNDKFEYIDTEPYKK